MKRTLTCIVFSVLFTLSGYSQACKNEFIEGIIYALERREKRFKRFANSAVNQLDNQNQLRIINIPVVFPRRNVSGDIEPDTLLCLLNPRSVEFDKAIVLKGSTYSGMVTKTVSCEGRFFEMHGSISAFRQPLAEKIMWIEPDLIFRVEGIPRVYWYINDEQLFVLTYEHQLSKIFNFRTYNVTTYLDSIFTGADMFLTRPIWVISGSEGCVIF